MLSDNIFVPADKTTNMYEMPKDNYNKLLQENITKNYKKCDNSIKTIIDTEAKMIAGKIGLEEKMECYAERNAFITLKDHKENFRQNPKCRLINPAKSEMGLVSKTILEKVIHRISESTNLNQWRNTTTVIDWFKRIPDKKKCKFIKFDIVDFYPSINEDLLGKALTFASNIQPICNDELKIIKHARKSLLFKHGETWEKKDTNNYFDITMGSFDGAEVCETVGLYLLNKISTLINKENVGLYRDDGLAVIPNANGPQMDRLRKQIIKLFKDEGLSITIETNLSVTDFLDVTFDLPRNKFYPYRKMNDKPLYVNGNSNHPESITKQLPKMINRRISELSCCEADFITAKPTYEAALNECGHKFPMKYEDTKLNTRRRNRNVIWFNPPFSQNIKTNIGKIFIQLVKKHFPRHHKFYKIFNPYTLKLSYSCMPNMENLIKQHNNRILRVAAPETDTNTCNCRNEDNCPMNGNCMVSCVVYKATVTTQNMGKVYFGVADKDFKGRYNNHTKSFRLRRYANDSELSKYVWQLHDKNTEFNLKWEVEAKCCPYKCGTRRCDLCITEKFTIARSDPKITLNKKSELVSKCRHRNKHCLKNLPRL